MATESETTSPNTTTIPDKPMKLMVNEEVKPMAQENVSLPEEGKEEKPKIEELPSETKPSAKVEEEAKNEQTEPPAVEVKVDDSSNVDAAVEDKIELGQDTPHSHAHNGLGPAGDAVKSHAVAPPANESVVEVQEEQPARISEEKMQQEQPTIVNVSESSAAAVEKPKELSAILPTKESEEVVVKDPEDSVLSKENNQELLVSEVAVKVEEQAEVTEHSEKPESVSEIRKQQEPPEVLAIKESEAVVEDIEASEAASKEIDEPESVVPEVDEIPKEKSEVAKQDERVESIEATEKQQESSAIVPVKESEVVVLKVVKDSAVPEDVDKPESVVPAEVEMKPEEQFVINQVVEKPESLEAEADLKLKVGHEVPEKVEIKSVEETEPIVPTVEVEPVEEIEVIGEVEPKGSIKAETVMDEGSLADKVEDTTALKEEKTSKEGEPSAAFEQIVLAKQEAEDDCKEGIGESSLADVAETTDMENGKNETDGTKEVEAQQKEATVEMKNGGREREEKNVKSEDENVVLNKELVQPIKADGIMAAVSNTEVTERSIEGEKTSKVTEPVVENEKEENIKEETPPLVETSKDGFVEGNLDEGIIAIAEPANESQDSGLEVEDEKNAKTSEDKVGKENAEKIAISDAQNLEPSNKSSDDAKASQDLLKAVPAKTIENKKEETQDLVETSKEESIEGKLEGAITAANEPVKKSQDSGLEVKDEESAKTSEGKIGKENAEEIPKSDASSLEPSTKDGDDAKASQDLPREVPAKPIHKQSNNILTKVKHSLVKAKKAIIGKSPSSKTISSDTKGDVKVK